MPGNKSQQTSSTTTQPWSGAQPALNTALKGAQDLYNSGVGGGVYTGSTVVPYDVHTGNALNQLSANAYANTAGRGAGAQFQNIIDAGGYNPAQSVALKNTQNVANANWSVSPELQKIINQTNADATTNVGLANSAAGRYGSGLGNSAIADTVSKNTNNLLYSDLNNFNTRKDAANSNLFNMGQTGIGNLASSYQNMNAPLTDLMKVGATSEDMATRQLNDKLRIFDAQQNRPWENLSRLNAIASGAGQLGGTQTTAQPGANPWLQAAGYGLTGAGLLGSFF
jgi:hypothetical protein